MTTKILVIACLGLDFCLLTLWMLFLIWSNLTDLRERRVRR